MEEGASLLGAGREGRLVGWEQADPPVRCADLPPCVGGLFRRDAPCVGGYSDLRTALCAAAICSGYPLREMEGACDG